jgi:hypothetical protein
MRAQSRLVVVGCLLSLAGCKENNRDAIARMRPEFALLRARLAKIGQTILVTPAGVEPHRTKLSPPPVFDAARKQFNTDIFAFEQLADIYAKPRFDLIAESDLVRALQYTGEHNPAAEPLLRERKGKEMEQWLRAALGYRYIVVYRAVSLIEPTVVDEHSFTPGQIALALYVVDLANGDQVYPCGVAFGHTALSTSYTYKQGEDPSASLAEFAHSTMYESVRKAVRAKLGAMTNGRFVLDP